MGNFVLSLFSCGSHSVGPRAYRASCTESVDVNEMSSLIRQKRQEMELSWFSNTLPGSGRVDFVPWSVEAEVIPLITSVLPRTIFPASTMSLDTFGTYHKGYALAHTQGGGEKKQTSGTSNTRGSRRKPATTVPTRRSTRNTRAETVSQPQKSPVSNNSECDAPGNSNSSVSISPPAESEKQTRQAPKRKSVRRGRKQPSLKKKLRKSVPAPEKTTSSDSVEEETLADSDTPPMLEKEQQSGIESSSISSVQTDGENHLVNCLKSCSEQTEENEQTKKHVLDEEVEFLYSEPYTQDPPMLVGEDTGIETKELGVEHEVSTDTSVKGSDPLGNEEQTSGSTESEVQALVCAESPPDDFLPCPASDIEGPQPVSSPLGERSENIGSVINDETIEEDLTVESTDGKDSPVNIEAFEESLKLESCEGEITHTLDRHCVASLVTELPEHVQTVNTEIMPTHDTSDNENSGAIQDCEDNLLKHNLDNTQLDKSSEEKKESLSEHPLPIEFSDTQTEQSEKHFSEDNNETVPMECDSFCSDQNESEMESSVNTDSKQSSENSVTHSSENKLSFDHPAVEKVETVAQPAESLLDKAPKPHKHRNDCPTWVTEKINSGPDPRTRNPEKLKDSHWEENRNENSGNSWSKNFGGSGWISNRGRGGRGKGTYRGNFAYTEQSENRWQSRTPLSGSDSFKSVEQQPSKRKSEQDLSFGTPADRSGWTSASSWAVRKTLPADVQNYYSRRGRNSSGPQSGWMRQEEEAPEQDCNLKDQTNQVDGSQLPVNMMQQHMNVIQPPMNPQHQPMSIFPYPVGVHAPLMNMQRNPFTMHPQLPMHLHTGVPLMQVAAPASVPQGLPPPPPPPPSQQVSYIASQPDGKQVQGLPSACHVSNNMTTQVLPAPAAAPGNTGSVQGPSSGNTSSSSHVQASNAAVKLAESKKLQIQEKAAQEVKLAIKPFYQNKDITKEEYKEIVRKAVDKVCHSKSGEVNSTKVANLVKAYVDKYKYSRKGSQKKALEEPVSTEKNIG
ncbi:SR-related CTD-associated factor 11 [Cricetulus griseus]